jgi:hypothetical protein
MMIDSDVQFDVEGFLRVALSDHDLIGGTYPMKNGWNQFVGVPVISDDKQFTWDKDGNILAEYVSGGFTKISRNCLKKMFDHYKTGYTDPTASYKKFTPELFECQTTKTGRRATEDYVFCQKWKAIGGDVWIDPTVKFRHFGINGWGGCYIDNVPRRMVMPTITQANHKEVPV